MPRRIMRVLNFDRYLQRFNKPWKIPILHRMITEEDVRDATPKHQVGVDICRWCLTFKPDPAELTKHQATCYPIKPPGVLAYDDGKFRFYLIMPRRDYYENLFKWSQMLFKRMAKFQNNQYNFNIWNFCVVTAVEKEENGEQVENFVGFFTKPARRIVLADLTIMPKYRSYAVEQLIIDFAYLLGVFDGKDLFHYPDMPVMLRKSFQEYWRWKILLNLSRMNRKRKSVYIEALKKHTSIATEDIVNTLNGLDEIDRDEDGDVFINFQVRPPGSRAMRKHLKIQQSDYDKWNKHYPSPVEAYPLLRCSNRSSRNVTGNERGRGQQRQANTSTR